MSGGDSGWGDDVMDWEDDDYDGDGSVPAIRADPTAAAVTAAAQPVAAMAVPASQPAEAAAVFPQLAPGVFKHSAIFACEVPRVVPSRARQQRTREESEEVVRQTRPPRLRRSSPAPAQCSASAHAWRHQQDRPPLGDRPAGVSPGRIRWAVAAFWLKQTTCAAVSCGRVSE